MVERFWLVVAAVGIGLTNPTHLRAQTPPRFEVASVKMAADQEVISVRPSRTAGRFRWNSDLLHLLGYAYNLEKWRISGVKSNPIYDIEAINDLNATDEQVRLMLQSLLIDRLKMAVHRVTKDVDGYLLTVAKGGPRIQEAKEGEIPALPPPLRGPSDGLEGSMVILRNATGGAFVTGRRVTMLQFIEDLQRQLNTVVLDRTGLAGKYYFAMQFSTGFESDVPLPSLFGAVKDLGLNLEKYKSRLETLVVDHIEKMPTEN